MINFTKQVSFFKYFICCVVLCCSILHTKAVTRNVNSYATLTAAIAAASDGDIIYFTDNIVVSATISVTKALTFQGNSFTLSVPVTGLNDAGVFNAGASTFRVFDFNAASKTITLERLTIKGGATTTDGGALQIAASTIVIFDRCTISNSRGPSSGGAGGILNFGNCYLYRTTISRNAAGYGGGFLNYANMFMENCTVVENRSLCANCGGGGGSNNTSASRIYVNNSIFSNNTSSELGGAFNNYQGGAYFVNTSFTGNVVYGSYRGGAYAHNSSNQSYLINCLFAYNYCKTTPSSPTNAPTSYVQNDVEGYSGTTNLYYCIFTANTIRSGVGTNTEVIGNNTHALAADGSNNDLFTGGVYDVITDENGNPFGTASVFRPFLVNVNGNRVPTLKTGSYAVGRGSNTGFTNGSGTPVIGYQNMSTSTWVNLLSSPASSHQVTSDMTGQARATTPTVGAVERIVDDYVIFKIKNSTGGTVSGASIFGEVYPSGTTVSITALPSTGYQLTNWTYNLGGSGTVSGNPLSLAINENTTLTPNFATSSNYSITYIGNSNTSGMAPAIAQYGNGVNGTIAGNTGSLARTYYDFSGWNTSPNGSGTDYAAGASYTGNTNLTLYAKWLANAIPPETLPVSWLSFTATKKGAEVTLQWSTAREENTYNFDLEHKANNGEWTKLGTVNAAGESNTVKTYSFNHSHPATGNNQYRILQRDLDGQTSYSAIRVIQWNTAPVTFRVLSNTGNNSSVTLQLFEATQLRLYNGAGQEVWKKTRAAGTYNEQFTGLSAGIYYLQGNGHTEKIVIR